MDYCPYCAEQLTKSYKICPYCKKTLDTDLLKQLFEPGESSKIDKKLKMKIWYKEKSHIFYPILTLIIGFMVGAFLLYGFAQTQFSSERNGYQKQIAELQKTIEDRETSAGDEKQEFENRLAAKDEIIKILAEQNDIFSRLIYFTSRLSSNSTITPGSTEDIDYYRRNTLYLIRLFNEQQDKLKTTAYKTDKTFNLQSIPQLLEQ